MGYKVYFLNPTCKWRFQNLFSTHIKKDKINDQLTIINYKNNFPQRIFPQFFTRLNDLLNRMKLNASLNLKNKNLVWWKFDPYRFLNTRYKKAKSIYHVVDPHMHLWQNKIHAENSDLIVCSSDKYIHYFNVFGCKNIVQMGHGISEEEFEIDQQIVNSITTKYGNFVIFIGAIAHDVNIDILQKIASEHINVLIIGTESVSCPEWAALKESEYVHYIGQLHAKELKNYIAASKAGLIAYNFISKQKNQISRSPLKALNYLAQNKPVITSIDAEIEILNNQGIFKANDIENYTALVRKAVSSELTVNIQAIKSYLDQHKYNTLISNILVLINKC